MCGFVVWQSEGMVSEDHLRDMSETLVHRGPDAEGQWTEDGGRTGFAHRRLSIIDLESGQQPMVRDGYGIIYNGEIYNYRDLRNTLSNNGYEFRTDSDTEVFLQGYRCWGFDVLERVRGMFSISIWDPDRDELILARDTAGQKPLFYYDGADSFLAASEIQALLAHDDVARSADFASLSWYLSMGYVPSPRSGFAKIKKLPPGHYMQVKDGDIRDQVRYWDPVSIARDSDPVPEDQVETRIRESVSEAVQRRMVSDVPLGAFLSGGVDSTLIVGLMQQLVDEPLKTVTVGFENDRYDERGYAREVAEHFGTDHHEYEVDMELSELLPRLVRHFGEPFADSSAVPTFYVSQRTRNVVKVALSGDGGDECFGGYRRYGAMRYLDWINRWTPGFLRTLIGTTARQFEPPSDRRSRLGEIKRVCRMLDQSPTAQYLRMVGVGGEDDKARLAKGPLERPAMRGGDQWLKRYFRRLDFMGDVANRTMLVDVVTYLPEDLLVKTDITSMMNSLEVRCPFLDRDVMELAMRIPSGRKLSAGDTKTGLKESFGDLIPETVKNRDKMGFGVPLKSWFRENPEARYLTDVLMAQESGFFSIIDRYELEQLIEQHSSGNRDVSALLWALVVMKLWMKEFNVRI